MLFGGRHANPSPSEALMHSTINFISSLREGLEKFYPPPAVADGIVYEIFYIFDIINGIVYLSCTKWQKKEANYERSMKLNRLLAYEGGTK